MFLRALWKRRSRRNSQDGSMLIRDYVSAFEAHFPPLLDCTGPILRNVPALGCFSVIYPKSRFSDWDLHCRLRPDLLTADSIRGIEQFTRTFAGITHVGRILSSAPHAHFLHRVDRAPMLQFMAFIPIAKFGPFIDLHFALKSGQLSLVYGNEPDDEYRPWMMISCWRKLCNGDRRGALNILEKCVKPLFSRELQVALDRDPISFFTDQLQNTNYSDVVNYLNQ